MPYIASLEYDATAHDVIATCNHAHLGTRSIDTSFKWYMYKHRFPAFQSLVHNLASQYSLLCSTQLLLLQETGQCTIEHLLKTATSRRLCWSEATLYQQTNTMHYHT